MESYNVYMQCKPFKSGSSQHKGEKVEFYASLEKIGRISAENGSAAIDAAKRLPEFQKAKGLAKFPLVHRLDDKGNEIDGVE